MCETISLEMAFIVLTCLSWFPAGFFILYLHQYAHICRLHICIFLLFCFALAANRLFAKIPIRLWRLLLCLQQLPPVPDQLDPCSTLFQHCSNMFKFNQTLFKHNQTIKSMQFMISALESVAQICKILH